MKNNFIQILLLLIISLSIQAQQFTLEIVKNGNNFEYYLSPNDGSAEAYSGALTHDLTFTVEYPTIAGVTLGAFIPVMVNNASGGGMSPIINTAGSGSMSGSNTRQGYQIGNFNGIVMPALVIGSPILIGTHPFTAANGGSDVAIILQPGVLFGQPNVGFNGFEDYTPTVLGSVPLPIKLTSFTAVKFEENSGKLDWASSSEVNGSHFEIERSTDNSNWEKIGVVKAVGESTKRNKYEFIDRNVGALRSNTTFYYRLKMVDNDNSYEYSAVRSITFTAEGVTINIYPNPTTDKVSINMSSEASLGNEDANAIFRSIDGKILLKNKISSNGITEFNMNDVPSGLILIQIEHNNKIYQERIIKID